MGKQKFIKVRKTLAVLLVVLFALSVTAMAAVPRFHASSFSANPTSGSAPLNVQFTDQSSATVGITAWKWDFGDQSSGSTVQNPTHTYNFPGTYTVKLTTTDANGGTATYTKTNFIKVEGINCDFKSNTRSGPAPLNVDFTDISSSDSGIKAWSWDFGDGTTSTVQTPPTHTYNNPGSFTVKLTVTDGAGNTASEVKKDYIIVK